MHKIEITTHAKQRLKERMPTIHPKNYYGIVRAARYQGLTECFLRANHPQLAQYIFSRFHGNQSQSTEIRVYKNYVFIFCGNHGHSRTLRTVVDIPQQYLQKFSI